jgi:cell division protein FtsB
VFETSTQRKSIGHPDLTDLNHHRTSSLNDTEIEYLAEEDEEELIEEEPEVVEKRPARVTNKAKKKNRNTQNLLTKLGWAAIGLLVLRLIFMDRGVWDYFATEGAIKEQKHELQSLRRENKEIEAEISRIQLDQGHQRQLAKEHLGVIAADEFLILFAGESTETPSQDDRLL